MKNLKEYLIKESIDSIDKLAAKLYKDWDDGDAFGEQILDTYKFWFVVSEDEHENFLHKLPYEFKQTVQDDSEKQLSIQHQVRLTWNLDDLLDMYNYNYDKTYKEIHKAFHWLD